MHEAQICELGKNRQMPGQCQHIILVDEATADLVGSQDSGSGSEHSDGGQSIVEQIAAKRAKRKTFTAGRKKARIEMNPGCWAGCGIKALGHTEHCYT